VTVPFVDTAIAAEAVDTWSRMATRFVTLQHEVESSIASLAIGGIDRPATRRLAGSATEAWRLATFVTLAVDAVVAGDQIDIAGWAASAAIGFPVPYSPLDGDLDHTQANEVRAPWTLSASSDVELGLTMAVRALGDTASNDQIRTDEIEMVWVADHLLLVLPGVTDLSGFASGREFGLSDVNATPRDTDRSAVASFGDTSLANNLYAQAVFSLLRRQGVAPGTRISIVGHSHGGDTALDLAADREFNGPGGYDVTHVLAVGYDTSHQLPDVPASTRVMAVENDRDLVVVAERLAPASLVDAATRATEAVSWVSAPVGRTIVETALDWVAGDDDDGGDPAAAHHRAQFADFDLDGVGHRQSTYIDFLEGDHGDDAAALAIFLGTWAASVTAAQRREHHHQRRTLTGVAQAGDVSLPRS
jgi:hypothetical protein